MHRGQVLTYLFMSLLHHKLDPPFPVSIGSPYRPSQSLTACGFPQPCVAVTLPYALVIDSNDSDESAEVASWLDD